MSRHTNKNRDVVAGKATLHDVAERAGVAPITVSRALRRPDVVAAATRARIDAAIAELGYVPDLIARSFRSRSSGVVAAIVPHLDYSPYAQLLQGLADVLREHGLELMMGLSGLSLAREEAILRTFTGRRPDGLVLAGTRHSARTREILKRAGTPVVETGPLARRPFDIGVGYREERAAAAMLDHLYGLGYRRVAFICGPLKGNERASRRRRGYLAAMRRCGLATHRFVEVGPTPNLRGGATAMARVLERWPETDCALASSDSFAAGALFECQRRGIAVPDELGIAGMLDLEIAGETAPALTTVRVPRYEIGRRAALELLERIGGRPRAPRAIDLGFELIPRESTRRLGDNGR